MKPSTARTIARVIGYFIGYAVILCVEGAVAELEIRERLMSDVERRARLIAELEAERAAAEAEEDQADGVDRDERWRPIHRPLDDPQKGQEPWWCQECSGPCAVAAPNGLDDEDQADDEPGPAVVEARRRWWRRSA